MIVGDLRRGSGREIVIQIFLDSLTNLRLQGRRTVLALFGVCIGCAAVVALLNIGSNAADESMRAFKDLGSNSVVASFFLREGSRKPGPANLDSRALKKAVPAIEYVSPLTLHSTRISYQGRTVEASVVGTNSEISSILSLRIPKGRFLSSIDGSSTYVVVGASLAEDLGRPGRPLRVGDRLPIEGYLFEVIGIVEAIAQNPVIPVAADQSLFIPIHGMRRIKSLPEINSAVALVSDVSMLEGAATDFKSYLSEAAPGHEVEVQIPKHLLDGLSRQAKMFSRLLAGLGGIALLMGGAGIMNVMLMSVAERRREIGVRMAIGARSQDIRNMFLVEVVALTSIGAMAGVVIGVLVSYVFVLHSGWDFSLSPASLPLGVGSALIVGVISGLYPAFVAAQLEPVQALRDE